jgi:hypothetical protein
LYPAGSFQRKHPSEGGPYLGTRDQQPVVSQDQPIMGAEVGH